MSHPRSIRGAAVGLLVLLAACAPTAPEPIEIPPPPSSAAASPSPSASPSLASSAVVEEVEVPGPNGKVWTQRYRPAADGSYPVLLYAPGLGASYASGEPFAASLVEQGYVVYLVDFVGGSNSSRSGGKTEDMTVFTEVADLQAVVDDALAQPFVDASRIYLAGVSHGGVVAALTAAERDDVSALFLICPAFGIDEGIRSRYPTEEELPSDFSILNLHLGRGYFEALYDVDLMALASRYGGPTLIFHGAEDELVPISQSEIAVERLPDAHLTVLPDEGHFISAEAREEVLGEIEAFLANQ